jgi:imidazole glycerol-phosphate synthase subunit HisH
MIAIVDYGAGNLCSVKKALDHLQMQSVITADPDEVAKCQKIVLPGVGNFATTAMLGKSGLGDAILDQVKQQVPFLGICVGMQWMFDSSEEAPKVCGAGLLSGMCRRFPPSVKSPHVGWSSLHCDHRSLLFRDVASNSFVYFTHSYRAPIVAAMVASCDYGGEFSAAVEQSHLFGVQFHPEKSGRAGLKVLQNFCAL